MNHFTDTIRLFTRHALPAILLLATLFGTALAEGDNGTNLLSEGDETVQTLARLTEIRALMAEKRAEEEALKKQLKRKLGEDERIAVEKQLAEIPKTIERLNNSFEQLAIGGIDLNALSEAPPAEFDWQKELEQITRPLLAGLRDLTEKPRRIEQLRTEMQREQDKLKVIAKATSNLEALLEGEPSEQVRERVNRLLGEWRQREHDANSRIEVIEVQIASLKGENLSVWESVTRSAEAFFQGRGLTLLLALSAAILIWTLGRMIHAILLFFHKRGRKDQEQTRWERLLAYGVRFVSLMLVILAILAVFYLRGDLLMLALGLLIVFALLVGLRGALPKYYDEIRLLLDLGAIRVGERVIFNGVPMLVRRMHAYVILDNPELEGSIRLPIDQVDGLISRSAPSEPWFPCRPEEYILLEDGRVAQVKRQTVEFIDLRIATSIQRLATGDFLSMGSRNLSRATFGVSVVFGVDYRHQAICLDQIPARLRRGIEEELERRDLKRYLVDLLVEFREAGANSLDYQIFATMKGAAAAEYFTLGRAIQRGCVDACNREGWVIPFAQLTLHQGEGFDGIGVRPLQA
jgi:hypothetical protein